jgi:hypothetical protein
MQKGDPGCMNYSMIRILILKDWYLQRWSVLASLLGGLIALGIVCLGGNAAFMVGLVLLITALIAVGAQLAVTTMVNERKEQTLPFVMSLPISYREYTSAKLLGTLLIFMLPWLTLVMAVLVLSAALHGHHGDRDSGRYLPHCLRRAGHRVSRMDRWGHHGWERRPELCWILRRPRHRHCQRHERPNRQLESSGHSFADFGVCGDCAAADAYFLPPVTEEGLPLMWSARSLRPASRPVQ